MAFFLGEFETTIDAKHRLAIGSIFRDQVVPEVDGESWVLVVGPDKHLRLYPNLVYQKMVASRKPSVFPTPEERTLSLMLAMARPLKSDSQGRVVLPEKSLERAEISEKVTLVGMNERIEIWPTEAWERYVKESLPSYGQMLYEAGAKLHAGE
ncbi:MAG: cell division/cell wall cluster transcriptional repressor MraZ [Phycisphaerae bacterium]|nr:cell division/cell wall cluster transcriptional repressor MraZ [Phycisphaerae bacterium]